MKTIRLSRKKATRKQTGTKAASRLPAGPARLLVQHHPPDQLRMRIKNASMARTKITKPCTCLTTAKGTLQVEGTLQRRSLSTRVS